jgi:hypothetical protein
MTYSFKPAAVLLALLGVTDVAFADAGDQISNVTLPIVGDGGFSIAADCSETLYYTNEDASELFVTDKNGIHNGRFSTVVAGSTDKLVFTEMAWDKGRGMLWAAADPDHRNPVQVYLLDPTMIQPRGKPLSSSRRSMKMVFSLISLMGSLTMELITRSG